jgi:hypothetical protein
MSDTIHDLRERAELIDDRAIASADEDQLRHTGFSEELAELVRTVSAPANVALFGSWGAGKSGLGRLLRQQLDGKDGIRCVIYDAFKYADFPLRRDFIAQVASSLEIESPEFHEQLYTETTGTKIKLPLGGLRSCLITPVACASGGADVAPDQGGLAWRSWGRVRSVPRASLSGRPLAFL